MKLATVTAALFLMSAVPAAAACPATAPSNDIFLSEPSCGFLTACPNGELTLVIEPLPSGGFPPAEYDPGYTIQPCDTVTWSFGDGMTRTVSGSNQVVHNFPSPGNYTIGVTITNALGSVEVKALRSMVIADSPARASVITKTVQNPRYPGGVCTECVLAYENDGTVTVDVVRSLDLTRTISVEVRIDVSAGVPTIPRLAETLVFGPGETHKSVTIPITDDEIYYGPRWYPLRLANGTGGVLVGRNSYWEPTLLIVEDEAQPVLSLEPAVSVREGDGGLTPYSIAVQLSAPMFADATAWLSFENVTATMDDVLWEYPVLRIPAGETSGVISGFIKGDPFFEPDETFIVRARPNHTNQDPAWGNVQTVVTILNDDSAEAPPSIPTLDFIGTLLLTAAVTLLALKAIR